MGAGEKVHLLNCVLQVSTPFGIKWAALAHLLRTHRGIRADSGRFESFNLNFPRDSDALADRCGRFANRPLRSQFAKIHQCHIYMDVVAVVGLWVVRLLVLRKKLSERCAHFFIVENFPMTLLENELFRGFGYSPRFELTCHRYCSVILR